MQRLIPLLVVILALLAIVWWSQQELRSVVEAERARSLAGGNAIIDTLIGSLQAGVRRNGVSLPHMQTVAESVVESARLVGFRLELGTGAPITAGETLPAIEADGAAGFEEHAGMLLLWRQLKLEQQPFGRRGRGPNAQDSNHVQMFGEGAQLVLIGLDIAPRQAAIDAATRRVTIGAVTAALGALALGAWMLLALRSRHLQQELLRTRAHAEHLAELNLAAAGLAHETKNPIGIIRGLAQRMAEADDPTSLRDDAQAIVQEADVAVARLGDFLRYARDPKPEMGAVALPALVDKITKLLAADSEAKAVRIEQSGPDCHIHADAQLCEQILMNLLLNALQACDGACTVRIAWDRQGDGLVWTVADDGPGIPSGILDDVTKPYVSGRDDGHGLGLALVRRFVDAQGWRLRIESSAAGCSMHIEGITILGGSA